jgi:hypothetical protein
MSPLEKRERATGWYQQWIDPVTEALYLRELEQARARVGQARAAIAQGALEPHDPAAASKAGYLLDYAEYFIAKLSDSATALAQCPQIEARLSTAAGVPAADALRRRLLLQFRCSAERLGYGEFALGDFQQLYESVPDEERNDEFWHFVSTWGFHHAHTGILEQAYAEYSVNKGTFMSSWLWWRVRLMYFLSAGRATEEDARQLLGQIGLAEHLHDFERTFVPALQQAALYTPTLEKLVEERRALIASHSIEAIKRALAE